MPKFGNSLFGVSTFYAASLPNDKCGANGLPLTPNSIKILGRFQYLKTFEHPNCCVYLDLIRSKHERISIVSEYYDNNLAIEMKSGLYSNESMLTGLAFNVLQALSYIHQKGLTHCNLSPENILLDPTGRVKLSNYGLYHMTGHGTDVAFPIGECEYMSPETIAMGRPTAHDTEEPIPRIGPKSDVWSLGMVLLETYLGIKLYSSLTVKQKLRKVLSFLTSNSEPLEQVLHDNGLTLKLKDMPKNLREFFTLCLTTSTSTRPTVQTLICSKIFNENRKTYVPHKNGYLPLSAQARSLDLEMPVLDEESLGKDVDHLAERSMSEVYYLWTLSGGYINSVLKKAGLTKTNPPVTMMPQFVVEQGEMFGQVKDQSSLYNKTVVVLSFEQLRQRLENLDETAYYPLLEGEDSFLPHNNGNHSAGGLPTSPSIASLNETASLPTNIKEKDIEYQFHRIILYDRLLIGYPHKRPQIWKEARVDVPPLVRNLVWAALLEVEGDYQEKYDAIDKETPTATDRQIEVDIPRCHQYDEMLSSPVAHAKFKRILKAWVVSHPQYVYWQGLDSLCAPFLYLNFNNEALAYTSLTKFIPKYLNKFFLKDNSLVIKEYLTVFSHLIAFHDPELSTHLDGIGFIPDLYAIPWFLTMYAHVFPLHKIFHLWDTLLLGNSSFPLCIGVAILEQLKLQHNLLSHGFNECILLFSDMPQIVIERCVQDSIKIFCNTPKSSTYRQYARPAKRSPGGATDRHSYYSQDYHDLPVNELSMEPVPLEELREEKCPRISAEDLVELGELIGPVASKSPTKKSKSSRPKILMIDVRSHDDYQRGCIPNSINLPYSTAFNSDKDLNPCAAVHLLNSMKAQVKVIIGNRGKNAVFFANELVRLGYSKVCILHKGIDVFTYTNVLIVPSHDL
ncbi:TBC domain-containing protein kinase-like protein isoform X2 [Tubulanus polymorphus]|uniref:TBC domain-containing protein kinase-like protein isoform X2 n=1 Tax=Tubulanus polymorphus TaxID=672921 RepID=UPI003DA369F0